MSNSKKEKSFADELNLKIPDNLKLNFSKGIFLKVISKIGYNFSETYILTALPTIETKSGLNPDTIWLYNFISIDSGIRLTQSVKDTFNPENIKEIIIKLINSLSGDSVYDKIELIYRTKQHICKLQLKGTPKCQ